VTTFEAMEVGWEQLRRALRVRHLVMLSVYLAYARRKFTHGEEWRSREDAVAAQTSATADPHSASAAD